MSLKNLEMTLGIKIANDLVIREEGKYKVLCYKNKVVALFDGKEAIGCGAPAKVEEIQEDGKTKKVYTERWGVHTDGNVKKFVAYMALAGIPSKFVAYDDFRALIK